MVNRSRAYTQPPSDTRRMHAGAARTPITECISRMGDLPKARFFFEKMLGYANHLGLYGEQLGLRAQHLGNFPQAFTHLALISAAYDLDRRLSAAGHPD